MAELSAYLRAVLSFGLVGVLIAFIASFSSCGIMSNDVIAILFGIVIIIAGGLYIYFGLKSSNTMESKITNFGIALFSFASAVCCFVRSTSQYSDYGSASRFFISIFVCLSLFLLLNFLWNPMGRLIASDIIQNTSVTEKRQQYFYMAFSLICAVIQTFILTIFTVENENEMVQMLCLRSLATTSLGFVIGGIIGGVYIRQSGNLYDQV